MCNIFLAFRRCLVSAARRRFCPAIYIRPKYYRGLVVVGQTHGSKHRLVLSLWLFLNYKVCVPPVSYRIRKLSIRNCISQTRSCLWHAYRDLETAWLPLGYLSSYEKNTCRYIVETIQDALALPIHISHSHLQYKKAIIF
jgi:hypothetical protein